MGEPSEGALIVGVQRRGIAAWELGDHLDELELLLDTAGGRLLGRVVQERVKPDAATFIGSGKVEELAGLAKACEANLIIFDDDLSPAQTRNLQQRLGCKVIDRAGLILDIFARRARTRESRIQVELAQLNYLLPRLTRRWAHLSRQYGGIGTRGPVGSRGPGETQLETDKRAIGRRITQLRTELSRIEKARETRRSRRRDAFKVAIVGYTNAGKSTLLNALTRSDAFVEDRLFATLDPTARAMRLPDGTCVVLIDTVGFIRKLPPHLVASFKSTLEESRQADLFMHVVDISHPHWEGQLQRVGEILTELDLGQKPQLLLFNKVDKVDDAALLDGLKRQYPGAHFISALRGIRLYEVPGLITGFANRRWVRGEESFRPDEGDRMRLFEEQVQVVGRSFREGWIVVEYMREGG